MAVVLSSMFPVAVAVAVPLAILLAAEVMTLPASVLPEAVVVLVLLTKTDLPETDLLPRATDQADRPGRQASGQTRRSLARCPASSDVQLRRGRRAAEMW
jgi:hypothetical protein